MSLSIPNSKFARSLLAGMAGLVVYGSWAAFANFEHGFDIARRSGLVQGSYSLVLTFLMTLVTEWLFAKLVKLPSRNLLTTILVSMILFTSAYSIHMVVGTPEIPMTILPGFVIGTVYTFVYVLGLSRTTQT